MSRLHFFLMGVATTEYLVACLFFFRYAEKMGDRLFTLFGTSFFLFAIERVLSFVLADADGVGPTVLLIRLSGFVLIIAAILNKNHRARRSE